MAENCSNYGTFGGVTALAMSNRVGAKNSGTVHQDRELKLLNELVSLPIPWRVTSFSFSRAAGLSLVVQHSETDLACRTPGCKGTVRVADHVERRVEDFPAFGWRVILKIVVPRLRCSECPGIWRLSINEWASAHATRIVKAYGLDGLRGMWEFNAGRGFQHRVLGAALPPPKITLRPPNGKRRRK